MVKVTYVFPDERSMSRRFKAVGGARNFIRSMVDVNQCDWHGGEAVEVTTGATVMVEGAPIVDCLFSSRDLRRMMEGDFV